jgi:hypothetical protein
MTNKFMSNTVKVAMLFIALTASFSFSQKKASWDSSDASSYYSTQIEKKKTADYGCPNGSYINSYGNIVCRPSASNAGGATAVCRDGTYSYSQSRRGTCSKHGGVARWL